jgi:hypothetical protein
MRSWERSADGVAGPGRAELWAAVRSPAVVMGLILGQVRPQMPVADDEHRAGDLGPGGEHEPFRISVRGRAAGRGRRGLDAGVGQDRVRRRGELPGPVTGREPGGCGAVTRIGREVTVLRPGPGAVRVRGDPGDVQVAAACLGDERAVQPLPGHRSAGVEEVGGGHRRCLGSRELRPRRAGRRLGPGGSSAPGGPWGSRSRRPGGPGVRSSPWIRWYPPPLCSVAGRAMSAAISVLAGGGLVRFRVGPRAGDQAAVPAQDGARG